jgi:hypothetical protein
VQPLEHASVPPAGGGSALPIVTSAAAGAAVINIAKMITMAVRAIG